ncbi:MAG: hypothetical protein AAGD25_06110 [Cyanobacteria bacterium P01_F01_bin.150]
MSQLTINLVQGSVTFQCSVEAAKAIQEDLSKLIISLKAASNSVGSGQRPQRQESLEYRYTGDVFLELFCNPNIWPSPFAAKVLITLKDNQIRLTTEAELTQVIEDINQYLEQNS